MDIDAKRLDTRKAMAFDLCNIIDDDLSHETYTKEEIKKLICYYIATSEQETSKQAERNDGEWKKNKMRKL
jgi:hypothetical protein